MSSEDLKFVAHFITYPILYERGCVLFRFFVLISLFVTIDCYLPTFFRAASLELEQSYECFTAREVTLNDLVHTVHIVMWQTRI